MVTEVMDKVTKTQARVRAYRLAQTLTDAKLRWVAFEGGDHVFLTPTGAEIRCDLVLGRATWYIR